MKYFWKFILFLVVIVILMMIIMISLRKEIQSYLFVNDNITPTKNIIVENWSGSSSMFKETKLIAQKLGCSNIGTIIYKGDYVDEEKKQIFLNQCQSVGIDTSSLVLIPVEKKSPNTLNNAITVIDSIRNRGWDEFTLVTPFHHSSRSKKVYTLVAKPYNIRVQCVAIPSFCGATAENWYLKPRGWMMIAIELVRSLYYELIVYPSY